MLKKLAIFVLGMSFALCSPLMAMANGNEGSPPSMPSVAGEAQAFQNSTATYDQSAGVQNINQFSVTRTLTKDCVITANGYGSISGLDYGMGPYGIGGGVAGLAFGQATLGKTQTVSCSVTFAKVDANINTMSGDTALTGNAGVSATGAASASAGNNNLVVQSQYLPYQQGGGGCQLSVASGYTNVTAGVQGVRP